MALPPPELLDRLGVLPASLTPVDGGASGAAWRLTTDAGPAVLRYAPVPGRAAPRVAAMRLARSAGLPVQPIIRYASTPAGDGLIVGWLPGRTVEEALYADLSRAHELGRAMGAGQTALHALAAPEDLPSLGTSGHNAFESTHGVQSLPTGDRLLHLDWHPKNLLVTDEPEQPECPEPTQPEPTGPTGPTGPTEPAEPTEPVEGARSTYRICGILDWDNAARGDPSLDLARTYAILTLDPTLASLPAEARAVLDDLLAGWAEGTGHDPADPRDLPPAAHAWAGRAMLADLASRYADRPHALDPIRAWVSRNLEGSA